MFLVKVGEVLSEIQNNEMARNLKKKKKRKKKRKEKGKENPCCSTQKDDFFLRWTIFSPLQHRRQIPHQLVSLALSQGSPSKESNW